MDEIVKKAEDLQDLTRLSEKLLVRLMDEADATSGNVWIMDQDLAFRKIFSRGKTDRENPIDPGEIIHRHEEISRGIPFFEQRKGKLILNSLFLPILHQDVFTALVHMDLRIYDEEALNEKVVNNIKAVADEFSPFLHNAQVLDRIRAKPLKDLESDTYNEPFMLDFVDRQLTISDRYRRRLGLISLEYEGAEKFQKEQSYRLVQAMLKDVSETLRGILRDYDVVAHVGNFRFFMGLPDTDSLGCRITIERIRRGFDTLAYLGERFERYGLKPHFGYSCFPEDGDTTDDMIMCSLERARNSRIDAFNDIDWSEKSFWDIITENTSNPIPSEISALDNTYPTTFLASFTYLLQESIINDIMLNPNRRGILYIGTDNIHITEALLIKNIMLTKSSISISVFGNLTESLNIGELGINTVSISSEQAKGFQFIMYLTDLTAYSLMGVHHRIDNWHGFHSSHPQLVERLVFKLRDEYSLQDQI